MALWVLFAAPTVVSVLQSGRGPEQVAAAAGFTMWGVVWVWFWLRALGNRPAEIVAIVANTVLLSIIAMLSPTAVGVGGVLVFAFIVAGVSLPPRQALWTLLGLSILQVVLMAIRFNPPANAVSSLLNSVLVGGIGMGGRLLWQSYTQLYLARHQLAQLAVSEERLRFARDLHDILGQSLSVLVLKSEVVARQLPADADESLRQEVREIAQVARKSLNDVREAVAGYRQATLSAEISSARAALRAAGIRFVVEDAAGALAPEQDAVLAWCLREAVTNAVKHSGAHEVAVRLSKDNGSAKLDVKDDGEGAVSLDGGSGLAGMRERVELVGGEVMVEPDNGGGLRVRVTVPAAS